MKTVVRSMLSKTGGRIGGWVCERWVRTHKAGRVCSNGLMSGRRAKTAHKQQDGGYACTCLPEVTASSAGAGWYKWRGMLIFPHPGIIPETGRGWADVWAQCSLS